MTASSRFVLTLTLTLTLTSLAGCTCGDRAAAPTAPTPIPAATPTPDPLEAQLAALRAAAAQREPGVDDLETLVDLARAVGDAALKAGRADVVAAAADVARTAGADRFAGALLQRATGLLDPAAAGKDHLWALARMRTDEGRVLEAVSLLERAVHSEPTTPAEWIGLSEGYLLADRVGPARAAVTRGLRAHEGDRALRAQGAEVMLVSGRADQALGVVDEVLAEAPDAFGAKLVRAECLLVLGRLDDAVAQAAALAEVEDAWTLVIRGAVAGAKGDSTARDAALDSAAALAGDCPCTATERAAIAWARAIAPGAPITPRPRAHPDAVEPTLAAPVTPGSAAPASPPPPR